MEASTLTDGVARMTSRAEIAERLLADARECLAARIAENTAAERNLVDATAARRDSERDLHELQDLLRLKQCQINELEQSRLQLIAATNTLLKTFQNRDAALVHADDEIKLLNTRIVQLEAQIVQLEAKARRAASQRKTASAAVQSQQTAINPTGD